MNRADTDRSHADLLDLLAALAAGKRLILAGTLAVCLAAAAIGLALPDEYQGVVQLLPPKEQKKGLGFAELLSDLPIPSLRLGEKGTPADIFVAILRSPTIRRQMVAHFRLMAEYGTDSMEEAIETLRHKTEIAKSEQGTIMISVLARQPQVAAAMANHYVVLLDSTNKVLSQSTAQERYRFISRLEAEQGDSLQVFMSALQAFQEAHNAISIEDQARATIRTAAEMQTAAMELVIKRLSLLQSGFSPTQPEVMRLEREAQMRQEALRFLRDGSQEQPDVARGRGLIEGFFLEESLLIPLRHIPGVAHQFESIQKDVLVQAALMKLLLQQKAEALIEASNTTSTVQVLDPAMVPEKPARPRRALIVFIAGVLSLFSCTVYVLAAVYLRTLRDRWRAEYAGQRGG